MGVSRVEHAGDATLRIVRIQDPAGKARTFTFDHGWTDVAEPDGTPCGLNLCRKWLKVPNHQPTLPESRGVESP